jgi:hypothetical protein
MAPLDEIEHVDPVLADLLNLKQVGQVDDLRLGSTL